MKKALLLLVLVAAAFGGGYLAARYVAGRQPATASGERKILYWVDPMHPWYKSDKPGIAPDCGMKLEPVYADGGGASTAAQKQGKVLYYRDPQDSKYRSDKPGINPETGNDLEPVYEGGESLAPGTLQINSEKQQMVGITYGTVEYIDAGRTFRANARVAADETRVTHVHSRTEGWAEQVFVDYTGQSVRKGQKLFTMYSPELLASQQEYLIALRGRDLLKGSSLPSAVQNSASLVQAARKRLELWDMSEDEVDRIAQTGKPDAIVTMYAPHSGIVLTRNVFPKQKITPEMDLYTLVDLTSVWIVADVFESDAALVRPGMPVVVSVPAYSQKQILGRVSFVLPQVDPQTRTLKVRIEAPNPGLALKPDMFVDAEFRVRSGRTLTAPASAVLNTGERKTAFVDRGNGNIEPRQVATGERFGDRVEILSGLKAGDRVVASANFLVDSESQLKGAMTGGAAAGGEPAQHGGHEHHD